MDNDRASIRRSVLIVDDHPVLRRGLAALIAAEPDLTVSGEAATIETALEAIEAARPDLVIVDLALGDRDGLELIKEVKTRHPGLPTLVLSMHDESVYAERSLRAGARGYVTKQQLDNTVLIAIRHVLDGEIYMSEQLTTRLATKFLSGRPSSTAPSIDQLSDRELQVFRLIGQGRSTRQIAQMLDLSIKTIESHRGHIKEKLGLGSASELAQRATQFVETGRLR